ncbi:MAG: hypothetical protein O7D86_14905 [Proteobacteria bacterium]|nr:hypothetical protein [Pseudomonadota bacterium]
MIVFIQGKSSAPGSRPLPASMQARRDDAAWPPPAKRSNAAMDENGRAMDIAFPCIMGILLRLL